MGHGLDGGGTKGAITLATGIEQRFETAELIGSLREPINGGRLKRDVENLA
tara:strand:+ start:3002 stop:3154 length:153 start_codon:yes stop_codon:yes gene_type:complete